MFIALLTTALAAPALPSPTAQLAWSPEAYAVDVQGGEIGKGTIAGVIDASPAEALAVILDCDGTDRWFPQIRDTSVVTETSEITVCAGRTDLPWPMQDRTWNIEVGSYSEVVDGQEVIVVPFLYVGGGNLVEMYGGYHLAPYGPDGQQTLVTYEAWVDLGTWVPDVLVQWATKRILPGVLDGIEAEAHQRFGGLQP